MVSYRIKLSFGYNSSGKQIIKRSPSFRLTEGLSEQERDLELMRRVVEFERLVADQADGIDRHVTFRKVAEDWLELEQTTQQQKKSSIYRMQQCKERAFETLGDKEICKIKFLDIQAFVLSLAQDGVNQRTGKGLSEKTQKHYITFVSDVFKYAKQCGYVESNPCRGVKTVKTAKKDVQPYTLEEEQALLAKIDELAPLDYKTFFYLAALLGLRRGELLGLEFKDFDLDKHTVNICRTSNYRNSDTGIYESTPKTKSSNRILAVPQKVIDLVRELKANNAEQGKKCGDLWHDTDRLFIMWDGKPMSPNTPYTWLQRFCERNTLPFKGLHAFRHSFATHEITSGVDIATVSHILGHSQISTTLNVYTHSVRAVNAQAMDVMANLLQR